MRRRKERWKIEREKEAGFIDLTTESRVSQRKGLQLVNCKIN